MSYIGYTNCLLEFRLYTYGAVAVSVYLLPPSVFTNGECQLIIIAHHTKNFCSSAVYITVTLGTSTSGSLKSQNLTSSKTEPSGSGFVSFPLFILDRTRNDFFSPMVDGWCNECGVYTVVFLFKCVFLARIYSNCYSIKKLWSLHLHSRSQSH